MEPHREVVNRFLVEVFNEILKTEEDCLSQSQFRGDYPCGSGMSSKRFVPLKKAVKAGGRLKLRKAFALRRGP